jgi:hypothetical protein
MKPVPKVPTAAAQGSLDLGLRAFMNRVFGHMAAGVALTGVTASTTAQNEAMVQAIHGTALGWIVMLAPLAFVLVMSFGHLSAGATTALFYAFAGVMGLSLSTVFLAYAGVDIARTFFVTAAAFAGLALWGYATKRDLTGMGSFMVMGLIGLIVAGIANLFLQSGALAFALNVIGVLVFAGLTAYDTQKIKEIYAASDDAETEGLKAIHGALALYLDFVNLFLHLLSLMRSR